MNVTEELNCLKDVLDAMPCGIYWKSKEGVYLGCNKAQAKYWRGLTSDNIKGKTDDELYFRKRSKVIRESDRKVMQDKEPQMKEEIIRTPGEDNQFFLTQKLPLINDKGEVCGLVSMIQDVTDLPTLPPSLNELWRDSSYGKARERQYLKDRVIQTYAYDLHSVKMGLSALQVILEALVKQTKQ